MSEVKKTVLATIGIILAYIFIPGNKDYGMMIWGLLALIALPTIIYFWRRHNAKQEAIIFEASQILKHLKKEIDTFDGHPTKQLIYKVKTRIQDAQILLDPFVRLRLGFHLVDEEDELV